MELKGQILLYTIDGCRHCKAAKSKLNNLHLPFDEINLDDFPNRRNEMIELTSQKTVPQIFFNAIHVGGNTELHNLTDEELNKLISEVQNNPVPDTAPKPNLNVDAEKCANCVLPTNETDESASIIENFCQSGIIKDHRNMLTSNKSCFTGSEFIKWLAIEKKIERKEAKQLGQSMLQMHFFTGISGQETLEDNKSLYRLLQDEESNSLNLNISNDIKPMPASELSTLIRKKILKIYGNYLSEDGKCVDYDGIKNSAEFKEFVELTGQLQRLEVSNLSREEKVAFFINIYNALVIHGNVQCGFPSNAWKRYKFFNNVKYRIGGSDYSLQDIENGVLRANRKGIGMLSKPFGKGDKRLKVSLESPEPLMHFALVCGAKSCPPIKTYSADEVYDQLELAASSFLSGEDGCVIDMKKKLIKLSKILDWYSEDFGSNNDEVVGWVRDHVSDEKHKTDLSMLLSNGKYKLSHLVYDWGSNSKK